MMAGCPLDPTLPPRLPGTSLRLAHANLAARAAGQISLADSGSRRALMTVGKSLRTLAMIGPLLITATHCVSRPWLALLGFLGATGTVAFTVAGPADLGRANGRLELARSLAFASGPALAGATVAWAGAPSAFVLASVLGHGHDTGT